MSAFENLRGAARRTAEKITDRACVLTDSAVTALKLHALEARLAEQYENLGRLIYRGLHTTEDISTDKLRILDEIDRLIALRDALRAQSTDGAPNGEGDDVPPAP